MVALASDDAAAAAAAEPAPVPPPDTLTRQSLVWLFRRIIGIYFSEIEVAGNLPHPETGGRVFVSNHTNAIVDAILVLTTAPSRIVPVAKSTLWKVAGLRWLLDAAGAVPIQRRSDDPAKKASANEEVFDKIAAALGGGRNILIFPEGKSHNEPSLIEMKTGAARMLARAQAQGARGLTFQAVALEFDQRNVFRSRCLLVYGPVRGVDEIGLTGDALVAAITARVREDLADLLVKGATWPERLLITRVAEMFTNDGDERSLSRWSTIGRQVEAARRALREVDEPTVQVVADAVGRYHERLAEEGLVDEQLAAGGDPGTVNTVADAALWLSLPLAAAGTVLYAVPYYVTRFAAERIAAEPDELSTYKLGVGLLAYPVWAGGLMGAGWILLPAPLAAGWSAVVATSPLAALAWHDAMPRVRRAVRFATRGERLRELRELRAEAMKKVEEARAKVGM